LDFKNGSIIDVEKITGFLIVNRNGEKGLNCRRRCLGQPLELLPIHSFLQFTGINHSPVVTFMKVVPLFITEGDVEVVPIGQANLAPKPDRKMVGVPRLNPDPLEKAVLVAALDAKAEETAAGS
jgi:hypothetical protein